MAGFVARLDKINALADNSPGFVWRLQAPEVTQPTFAPTTMTACSSTMSIWETIEDIGFYVYRTKTHAELLGHRHEWFEEVSKLLGHEFIKTTERSCKMGQEAAGQTQQIAYWDLGLAGRFPRSWQYAFSTATGQSKHDTRLGEHCLWPKMVSGLHEQGIVFSGHLDRDRCRTFHAPHRKDYGPSVVTDKITLVMESKASNISFGL